jgi:2-polyprenyl-3-methyl-5-hydroxy-6-metoxy-1,4-benzoquinol methylase
MGRNAPGRVEMIDRLKVWSDRTDRVVRAQTSPYERGREADVYRRAKIVPAMNQRGELNMRCYEAAACGALVVAPHDTEEVFWADAPVPTYDPAHVEDFLGFWLEDDAVRAEWVARQRAWVAKETPGRHLLWLLDKVRERLPEPAPLRVTVSVSPDPTVDEQRRECAALVPPEAVDVLDLGCNDGGFGWWLKQQAPHRSVRGVDYAFSPLAKVRLDGFDTLDLEEPWPAYLETPERDRGWITAGAYDCVTVLDCLEHLLLPGQLLRRVRPLLKESGCVVASIPNIRNLANLFDLVVGGDFKYFHGLHREKWEGPSSNVLAAGHVRFFTRKSIERLFAENGYRIEAWGASLMGVPGAEKWHDSLAWLMAHFGADADGWKKDEAFVIQHLVRAVPVWEREVGPDSGVL